MDTVVIFTTKYLIRTTSSSEEWKLKSGLQKNVGIFTAIEEIKKYEQDNFGQVTTDLSEPEKVVNMYVYIKGEEILGDLNHLRDECWDRNMTPADFDILIKELKALKK